MPGCPRWDIRNSPTSLCRTRWRGTSCPHGKGAVRAGEHSRRRLPVQRSGTRKLQPQLAQPNSAGRRSACCTPRALTADVQVRGHRREVRVGEHRAAGRRNHLPLPVRTMHVTEIPSVIQNFFASHIRMFLNNPIYFKKILICHFASGQIRTSPG